MLLSNRRHISEWKQMKPASKDVMNCRMIVEMAWISPVLDSFPPPTNVVQNYGTESYTRTAITKLESKFCWQEKLDASSQMCIYRAEGVGRDVDLSISCLALYVQRENWKQLCRCTYRVPINENLALSGSLMPYQRPFIEGWIGSCGWVVLRTGFDIIYCWINVGLRGARKYYDKHHIPSH